MGVLDLSPSAASGGVYTSLGVQSQSQSTLDENLALTQLGTCCRNHGNRSLVALVTIILSLLPR